MSKSERRQLLADVYRRACAGCAESIARLRQMTRKHRPGRYSYCTECGAPCRTYNLDGADARCTIHRRHMVSMRERSRKRLAAAAALMLLAGVCLGADVRLAWDASPTEGITNYVLFAHTNAITQASYTNAVVRLNVGTNLTCTVEDPVPARWWFTVVAQKDGLESDISNVIGTIVTTNHVRLTLSEYLTQALAHEKISRVIQAQNDSLRQEIYNKVGKTVVDAWTD